MKKFGIALLGLLVVGVLAYAWETRYETNTLGQLVLIRSMTVPERTVADFDFAARFDQADVVGKARVGDDLLVLGDLLLSGKVQLTDAAGTSGYLAISGANLVFVTTATNGTELTTYKTNNVVTGIMP
jgi:hypothetical protein